MSKDSKKQKKKNYTFHISEKCIETMKKVARLELRSLSSQIEIALNEHIKDSNI